MEDKINALLENEEFVTKLTACRSADDLKALFAANGIELTFEEAKKLFIGNLDDKDLEGISGGSLFKHAAAKLFKNDKSILF